MATRTRKNAWVLYWTSNIYRCDNCTGC